MKKQDAISIIYRLKTEAYDKLQELNSHPDFMYWNDDKTKYRERYECYDRCLEILMKLD